MRQVTLTQTKAAPMAFQSCRNRRPEPRTSGHIAALSTVSTAHVATDTGADPDLEDVEGAAHVSGAQCDESLHARPSQLQPVREQSTTTDAT